MKFPHIQIDPNINPVATWPFIAFIRESAGNIITIGIILTVIALAVAGGMLAFSRNTNDPGREARAKAGIVGALLGAIIVGGASGFIAWATSLPVGV